jgi:molybdate transport system substrate-binding protein
MRGQGHQRDRRGAVVEGTAIVIRRRALVLAMAGFVIMGCGAAGQPSASASSAGSPSLTLTIYAAASLRAALARVAADYSATHPGTALTVSTDSSAALEAQIEQGAPADVFLSADAKNPQKLVALGLAPEALPFAGSVLAIVVPGTKGGSADPAAVRGPIDLARPGVKIVAAGDAVPITTYATELVANLARQPGFPPGFAAAYDANVVSREDNVSAIVSKVALGEGDAGIVYMTDALSSTEVTSVDVPPDANVVATYAGATLKGSRHPDAARAFLTWLAGPGGQAILRQFGFRAPP